MWLYIIVIILILYCTGFYLKLPEPLPQYFEMIAGPIVNDELEGIYESDFEQHGFKKYFMITKDITDDTQLITIRYRGSKSPTDDTYKLKKKEIDDMKANALKADYEFKGKVTKTGNKYTIFETNVTRSGTVLIFNKNGKITKYFKIQNI